MQQLMARFFTHRPNSSDTGSRCETRLDRRGAARRRGLPPPRWSRFWCRSTFSASILVARDVAQLAHVFKRVELMRELPDLLVREVVLRLVTVVREAFSWYQFVNALFPQLVNLFITRFARKGLPRGLILR